MKHAFTTRESNQQVHTTHMQQTIQEALLQFQQTSPSGFCVKPYGTLLRPATWSCAYMLKASVRVG